MNNTWWVRREDLDESQQAVISLPRNASHFVLGPPGSGKTNLLLLRAKYLALSQEVDFDILVFTRTLREFLRAGASKYSIDPNRVQTSHEWFLRLLRDHDVKHQSRNVPFEKQRLAIEREVEALIKAKGLRHQQGTILLDEAQDYTPNEIGLFKKLAKNIFAVGDIHQKIYEGESPIHALEEITGVAKCLPVHYRCGKPICDLADAVVAKDKTYRSIAGSCNYKEQTHGKCVVNRELCPNLAVQIQQALVRLRGQLKAFPDELLGVMCPTNRDAKVIWKAMQESDLAQYAVFQHKDEWQEFDVDHRICVCTIHSAKGLEFRAAHLLATESAEKFHSRTRNTLYTAITRARTALSIYHSGTLPPYLEKGIVVHERKQTEPTIDDVFRRQS